MRPNFARARTWLVLFAASLTIGRGTAPAPVGARVNAPPAVTQQQPVCAAAPITLNRTEAPEKQVPDGKTIASTITVTGVGSYLFDLNLRTDIKHTNNSNLDITLELKSRTGETVIATITTDNGGDKDDVFNGTIWDDQADPYNQVPYTGNPNLAADHIYTDKTTATPLVPEEALAVFNGKDPNGVWTLTISDDTIDNQVGSLASWSLILTVLPSAPSARTDNFTQNVQRPIPTGPALVTSTLSVSAAGTQLSRLRLTTRITHKHSDDLDITLKLESRTGAVVIATITTDNGGDKDDLFNSTVWDDQANPGGQAPYTFNDGLVTDREHKNNGPVASLTPEEALAAFNGKDPNGVWTLTIVDDNAGDAGTLLGWSLEVTTISCQTADLSLTKGIDNPAPDVGSEVLFTITLNNDGPDAATNVAVKDQLPAGLGFNSAMPSQGTYNNESGIWTVGTLAAPGKATLQIKARARGRGTVTNTAEVSASDQIDPNSTPGNNIPTENDQASVSLRLPSFEVSNQNAGSVLFYNVYTSGAANSAVQNTRINITNTNSSSAAIVHLFFVDGATCAVADVFFCLTASQTMSFLASELDPGTTGYLIAVAVDNKGCPVEFNHLIGDEYVKFQSGHAGNLGAEAFSALPGGLTQCQAGSAAATLNFDGVSYDRAPRVLALDNIQNQADGTETILVINRLGGNLATGAATIGPGFGVFFSSTEPPTPISFAFNPNTCQFLTSISALIRAAGSGWLKLWGVNELGLLGASFNFSANTSTNPASHNGAHNLHKLTLTPAASLTMPVVPPPC
jgi:uncharacterized repeat protein (TIGR01451 family)